MNYMNKLLSTNGIGEPKIAISHKTGLDKEIHLFFFERDNSYHFFQANQ